MVPALMYNPLLSTSKTPASGPVTVRLFAAEPVVGDDDVRDFDPCRGAGVLGDRVDLIVQRERGRSLIRHGGRRVDPELRVIEVSAAILTDDIQIAVAVHRQTFMLLGREPTMDYRGR